MTFITHPASAMLAPAEIWRRQVDGINADAKSILLRVAEARRIAKANGLPAMIAAAAPGAAIPGTTMPKGQAEAWLAMVDAVADFLQTEIAPGVTIEDGLYAIWPEVVPEEPAA